MSYNPRNQHNKPSQRSGHSPGLNKIRDAKRRRNETDKIMSPLWVLAPLLANFVSIFIMVIIGVFSEGLIGVSSAGASGAICMGWVVAIIVGMIIVAYPWYIMIKRRTEHFKRDHYLADGILEYLEEKDSQGKADLSQELATIRSLTAEMQSEEKEKSPALYTLLIFIIPYIGLWYVLYFLMKDIYEHHRKIVIFEENTRNALNKLGKSVVVPSWKTLPDRNFILYLVLSCCVPFFGLYWMYTIIKDYNEHFKTQWKFEDQIGGQGYEKSQGGGYQGPNQPQQQYQYQNQQQQYQSNMQQNKGTQPQSGTEVFQQSQASLVLSNGQKIDVQPGKNWYGRDDFRKLVDRQTQEYISSRHFRIIQDRSKFFIEDSNSTNNTRLNGEIITGQGKRELHDGDEIKVAERVDMTFKMNR